MKNMLLDKDQPATIIDDDDDDDHDDDDNYDDDDDDDYDGNIYLQIDDPLATMPCLPIVQGQSVGPEHFLSRKLRW